MLNTIISGEDSALPPVLLVHGLFGSAKNLGGLARRLEGTRKVISVDMRNHGNSRAIRTIPIRRWRRIWRR